MTTVAVHELLNTLYVMAQGAYLHVDHETLKVEVEGKTLLQTPVHHLGAVVCFGNVLVSPFAIHRCAEDGRAVVFMGQNGRFKARVVGPTSGNVLLRQAQYRTRDNPEVALGIARAIVAAKIQNARQVLLRGARQGPSEDKCASLRAAACVLGDVLAAVPRENDLDTVRGREGEAAVAYFSVLDHLILQNKEEFHFDGRNRRPPRDRVNALLSFLYALLFNDCVAALEGVGLDPQAGYLHSIRPGRAGLALDLMEELRAPVADRIVLTLINRKQIGGQHFEEKAGGSVLLTEDGRKTVVVAYQKRKAEEVKHGVLGRSLPVGLISHVQARLLARHLRGDMEDYLPYVSE